MCSKLDYFVTDVAVPSTAVTLNDRYCSGALASAGGFLLERKKRRLNIFLALWTGISMMLLGAPKASAQQGTGYAGSANQVQSIPAPSQEKSSGPAADSSDYVGAETCKACHEGIYNNWEKTPHWKTTLDTKGGPSRQGCEGCHGPGGAHVAGGGDKTKIFIFKEHSAKEINDRCLTCHASGTQQMNFINSLHAKSDVSCISCHS